MEFRKAGQKCTIKVILHLWWIIVRHVRAPILSSTLFSWVFQPIALCYHSYRWTLTPIREPLQLDQTEATPLGDSTRNAPGPWRATTRFPIGLPLPSISTASYRSNGSQVPRVDGAFAPDPGVAASSGPGHRRESWEGMREARRSSS